MNKYFEELYRQHSDMVLRSAYKILGDYHDAEDVVIEVYCKLYTYLQANANIQNVPGWLRVSANTTAIDMARKKRAIPTEFRHKHDSNKDFVDSLIQKCFADDILRDLYRKNRKWFAYICMRYLLEMSFEEIAIAEKTSPEAVKHSIQRAKRYLSKKHSVSGMDAIYPIIIFLVQIMAEGNI